MKSAWEDGVTSENIVSGFRACGIYPFNPHAIPNRAYLPSLASDVSQNTDTTPNISKSTITNTFLSLLKYSSCFTDRRCKHLLGICNPRKLLTLINVGLIDIIQEPNKNEFEIEEVSSLFWNSEIDQILTPAAAVQTSEEKT